MENNHAINGKIHYFDWVIFNSYVTNYQRVTNSRIKWPGLPNMFKQTRTLKCWIHLFLMFDPTANLVCLLVIAHLPGCTPHTGLVSSNLIMTQSPRTDSPNMTHLTTQPPAWWLSLPLWKIWKSVGMIIPSIWKNKKCSKPPTRLQIRAHQCSSSICWDVPYVSIC